MKMEATTKRLTMAELTPEELKQFDERMAHLIDDGYPWATANSVALDGILAERGLCK